MKSLIVLVFSAFVLAILISVEAKPEPGVVGNVLNKAKQAATGVTESVCSETFSEQTCGHRHFYYCDTSKDSKSKLARRCRYTGLFYGLVIGIPAAVVLSTVAVVGVVFYIKKSGSGA